MVALGPLEGNEELRFGASRLWQAIGKSAVTKGRPAFIRFWEKT